jgi:dTDP-4-dehydrorhamnose reductase
MSKVLITGANGFVGYYLTEKLLNKGFEVVATGKGAQRLRFEHAGFRYVPLDFVNEAEVDRVLEEAKPDVVVHCGAISKPDECELDKEAAFRINVTGTAQLLRAAERYGAYFLFMSTDFVFAGERLNYKEEDERAPVNYYGTTKLLAEDEVMQYGGAWGIVRTVLVYGMPFTGRQNILTSAAINLQKGETLKIFSDQMRTPTYVEDLVAGMVTMIEKRATGVYHLSGEDQRSPYQMVVAVVRHLGLDENKIEPVTAETFQQPARRPPVTGFDLSKARRDLGYRVTSFEEGLRRTFG